MVALALLALVGLLIMMWIVVVRALARRTVDQQRSADPGAHHGRAGLVATLVVLMLGLLASGTALGAAIDRSNRHTGAAVGAAFSAVGFLVVTWATAGVLLAMSRREQQAGTKQ